MALNTVTVTWDENDPTLAGLSGTISFTLSTVLTDTVDGIVVHPVPKSYPLALGTSKPLVANDNSAALPTGSFYTVAVQTDNGGFYSFQAFLNAANGATQKLSSLVPITTQPAMVSSLPLPSGTAAAGDVPTATGTGEASAWAPPGYYPPFPGLGIAAWNYPSWWASASTPALGNGVGYVLRMQLAGLPLTFSNLLLGVWTAGNTLTASECWATVYDDSGNKLGSTADQSGVWNTAGLKNQALSGAPFSGSWSALYLQIISNGSTGPIFARCAGGGIGAGIANLLAANPGPNVPFSTNGSGLTLPQASLNLASNNGPAGQSIWFGLV